jgi:hypothetical protein
MPRIIGDRVNGSALNHAKHLCFDTLSTAFQLQHVDAFIFLISMFVRCLTPDWRSFCCISERRHSRIHWQIYICMYFHMSSLAQCVSMCIYNLSATDRVQARSAACVADKCYGSLRSQRQKRKLLSKCVCDHFDFVEKSAAKAKAFK